MSLCKTIDTLAMAYLDDELAAEERHELEAHLTECATCRATLEQERADRSMIRRRLAVPAAPDVLRARIGRALDEQDRVEAKEQRRRWTSYLLPSSAIAAAAAAIALFVGVQMPTSQPRLPTSAAVDALKQTSRSLPLEVQGATTTAWLQEHFAEDVQPPQFDSQQSDSQLIGGRLLPNGINGHDAAMMQFQVKLPNKAVFVLYVLAVHDLRDDEMRDGVPVRVNGRTLYVFRDARLPQPVVSYVAPNRLGFMFIAPELSEEELIGVVGRINLIGPQ